MGVGELDVKGLGLSNNLNTLLGRNIVSNLGSENLVLHQKHTKLLGVVDGDLAETIGHQVTGDGVGSITDLGHRGLAGETTTDTVINTLGLAPGLLQNRKGKDMVSKQGHQMVKKYLDRSITIRLMALELLSALLENSHLVQSRRHLNIVNINVLKGRNRWMYRRG